MRDKAIDESVVMSDLPPASDPPDASADPACVKTPPAGDEIRDKAAGVFKEVKAGFDTTKQTREPYGLFAFLAAGATLVALLWWNGSKFVFWDLGLWTTFILAALALVFTPMVRGVFKLSEQRAHQFASAGAFGMAFIWIAFWLPDISSNQAFFGTFATAFSGIAAWMAPGRPSPRKDSE